MMHLAAEKQVTGEAIYVDDMPPFAGTKGKNVKKNSNCLFFGVVQQI